MAELDSLIDSVYQASFIPDHWQQALAGIAEFSGATSAAMLVVDKRLPPLFSSTPNIADVLGTFAQSPFWYENPRLKRLVDARHAGFLEVSEFSSDEERRAELSERNMEALDVAWQLSSVIEMPTGETVLFTIERRRGLPRFDAADVGKLDELRSHLGRASLMAARLAMQNAINSVTTLNAIGIAAAVVSRRGAVLAVNALFESQAKFLRPAAFGRLSLANSETNALLQQALPGPGKPMPQIVRSIPVPSDDPAVPPTVIHLVPLQRSTSDIFDTGAVLIAVTGFSVEGGLPPDTVLRGLFDLTAAEAAVARSLASGLTLAEAAARRFISMPTARTHLANIFRKTGTSQQSQLVALLKGSAATP